MIVIPLIGYYATSHRNTKALSGTVFVGRMVTSHGESLPPDQTREYPEIINSQIAPDRKRTWDLLKFTVLTVAPTGGRRKVEYYSFQFFEQELSRKVPESYYADVDRD
ncbi:jg12372 [Pararge aegeria aegeria]|uniref:Jg12372 protein n=1 Tax=Pararge aegeria aegeria TaxID=348720 RepID=A0A8S4SC56_9NEOP|nr:jg12372 [Pararge aegeria aegeria]